MHSVPNQENSENSKLKPIQWPEREEDFYLFQVKNRSQIRIQNGRGQPIDFLACISGSILFRPNFEIPPYYEIINNLDVDELEDLIEDIKVYQRLEAGKNNDFWDDSTYLVNELLKSKQEVDENQVHFKASKVEDLKDDIMQIFSGKNYEEMETLKNQINARIKGSHDIDIDYWNAVIKYLTETMAKYRIDQKLKEFECLVEKIKLERPASPTQIIPCIEEIPIETVETVVLDENDPLKEYYDMYENGKYSPIYIQDSQNYQTVCPDEDSKNMNMLREFIQNIREKEKKVLSSRNVKAPRQQLYGNHEEECYDVYTPPDFKKSADLKTPKFYNKIQTGYAIDKFNPDNFDTENPPPRTIIGYKFNLFYPDLTDKVRRPQYSVVPCKNDREYSILTFTSGPPYENISFKILNKEWNYNSREGFKCQYAKNTFQLWFLFKRNTM